MSLKDEINLKYSEIENQKREESENYYRNREEQINKIANQIIEKIEKSFLNATPNNEYCSNAVIWPRRTYKKYLVTSYNIHLIKSRKLEISYDYDVDAGLALYYVSVDDLKDIDKIVVSYLNKEQIKHCSNYGHYSKNGHSGYIIEDIYDFSPQSFYNTQYLRYSMFLSL